MARERRNYSDEFKQKIVDLLQQWEPQRRIKP